MEKACKRIIENAKKMSMALQFCIEEYQEDGDGLTAQQIIETIRDFLKDEPNEVNAYIFLHLLAYYPQSMTSYNLTPLMQGLIASTYYYAQNDKEAPKFSMDDLAELFHRSKSTIYDAIQKYSDLEKMIKAQLEEEKLREKAKDIALKQLVEEEKQKLKLERENNQRVEQITEQMS